MTLVPLKENQADLPCENSTESYWHHQPSEKLLGYRSTSDLPAAADVIVVGSGITGCFAARELVAGGKNVVMLEAREACWGATGRNGGHCQPLIYATKPHISRFEVATYRFLKALVEDCAVPCDWATVGGVHALPDAAVLALVEKHVARLRSDFPDLAAGVRIVTDRAELAALRIPHAFAAVFQPHAAKLWPYKLVCWVLERLVEEEEEEEEEEEQQQPRGRFNLQTATPATKLEQAPGGPWTVSTPRGQVSAPAVVLATNAYTSYLLPQLTGLLVPVRGQVAALIPPTAAAAAPLAHSHLWISGGSDDYLVQRPSGELILGGERLSVPAGGVGVSRDDAVDPVVGKRLRSALASAVKLNPPGTDEEAALEAAWEWSGIMGYSLDGNPWVGQVPSQLGGGEGGLWLSGGYTGHGMPVAARCAIAVAEEILGRTGGVEVPKEFRIEGGREEGARAAVLPTTLVEELRMAIEDIA